MRAATMLVLALIVGVALVLAWMLVDVRQVERGELPDVRIEPGNLPEYDVDVGRVRVDERVEEIEVPKVGTEPREVRVPVLDLEPPAGGDEGEADR